jgi:2-keto-3-deoxy-L-rhamnonate aldolase RhmA
VVEPFGSKRFEQPPATYSANVIIDSSEQRPGIGLRSLGLYASYSNLRKGKACRLLCASERLEREDGSNLTKVEGEMSYISKRNRILEALEKDEFPLGMFISTGEPMLIEILGYTGFDFCVVDMEHTCLTVERMEHCIRAADAAGITLLVRVGENSPNTIRHVIESGAQGVIVPHVKNREDARKAVEFVRYPPEGKCGICPLVRAANFSITGWNEHLKHSSKQIMVIPLLEDSEAIDNLEGIFAELKPGVDAVGFGPADFAHSLTPPGGAVNWSHPYVTEAFDKILEKSQETKIPIMGVPWPVCTPEHAKAALQRGVKIMLYQGDLPLFYDLCQDIVQAIKRP